MRAVTHGSLTDVFRMARSELGNPLKKSCMQYVYVYIFRTVMQMWGNIFGQLSVQQKTFHAAIGGTNNDINCKTLKGTKQNSTVKLRTHSNTSTKQTEILKGLGLAIGTDEMKVSYLDAAVLDWF